MHTTTAFMTGLLAAGLVTTAGAILAVVVHAAVREMVLVSLATVATRLCVTHSANSDGATQ